VSESNSIVAAIGTAEGEEELRTSSQTRRSLLQRYMNYEVQNWFDDAKVELLPALALSLQPSVKEAVPSHKGELLNGGDTKVVFKVALEHWLNHFIWSQIIQAQTL